MLLKCIKCLQNRSPIDRKLSKSAVYLFNTSINCKNKKNDTPKDKKAFLESIKEFRRKSMMIDRIPQEESIGTILKVQKAPTENPKDFKTVYKLPYIKYMALINRLKIYQTIGAIIAPIGSYALYLSGLTSDDVVYVSMTLGISGCFTFYSLGYFANRFVGFMYYNEKTEMVKIAFVDFWGRRREILVPVRDIMPRNEIPVGLIKIWQPLMLYSTNKTYKLILENGHVVDVDAFNKIM